MEPGAREAAQGSSVDISKCQHEELGCGESLKMMGKATPLELCFVKINELDTEQGGRAVSDSGM